MISTALGAREDDRPARIAKWRQLVDLLAQTGAGTSPALRAAAIAAVERLRAEVPRDQRRRAGEALAGRGDGVPLFAADEPAIAAPVLMRAQLAVEEWRAVIPTLPGASRALLRNRRDLPPAVVALLESFGPGDLALTSAAEAVATEQIRELVARIEAFRQARSPLPRDEVAALSGFSFETDAHGVVTNVEGAPRAALIGLQIADAALAGGYGVDGQVAGAFRRRAPFRDARLLLAAGAAAGAWRLTGGPIFNRTDGRFAGYSIEARRPRADEVASLHDIERDGVDDGAIRPLLHELRTPLNAILGFAAMIQQQLLGPAHAAYRTRAEMIIAEGLRLTAMLDDLESVVGKRAHGEQAEGLTEALVALVSRIDAIAASRGARILFERSGDGELPDGHQGLVRALERMVMSVAAQLDTSEVLTLSLRPDAAGAEITIPWPRALAALTVDERLERHAPGDDDARGPACLGLGFAIRLFEAAVRQSGGRVIHFPDRLVALLAGERLRDTHAQ